MGAITIGCPEGYGVTLTRQPGGMTGLGLNPPALGPLTAIESVNWKRIRSDQGTAKIIASGCTANDNVLVQGQSLVDPWAYEATVFRDSKIAFMGPVLDVIWHSDTAQWEINLGDMMSWTVVREIQPSYTSPVTDAASIIVNLLQTFFQTNGDDPDLFRHVLQAGTAAAAVSLFYKTATFSVADKIRDLVNMGANFTTVGRSIIVFGEAPPNLSQPMILSANQISGQVNLFKTGRSPFGVHAVGRGEGLTKGIGPTAANELYFGKVSRITQFGEINTQPELDALTQAWYDNIRVMRHDLDISSGSELGPDTLFYGGTDLMNPAFSRYALDFLIPGYRYDIAITKPAFPIKGAFPMRLDELSVDWSKEGGEHVKASFISLGGEQGA